MKNPLEYENPGLRQLPETRCWFGLFSYLSLAATFGLIIASMSGTRLVVFEIKPSLIAVMPFVGIVFGIARLLYDPKKSFAKSGLIINLMLIVSVVILAGAARLLILGIQ